MDLQKLVLFPFICWLFASSFSNIVAQSRDDSQFAVDVVNFKTGKSIRGVVLADNAVEGMAIAVSKQWLKHANPELYVQTLESTEKASARARLQMRDRLKKLADTKSGALGFLVQKELERMEEEIVAPPQEEYQFLVLKFKLANALSRRIATPANRKIALWSWHEKLADVETRKPSSLASELKTNRIDPDSPPPSLIERFYPVEESDEQWNIRVAIVLHRMEKPVEFQGTGSVMIQVDGEQRPTIASLMGQIMQSQSASLLQELAGGGNNKSRSNESDAAWTDNAISQADAKKLGYLRATQVRTNYEQGTATVESVFMVKSLAGNWAAVWRSTASQATKDQNQDALDRIKQDPQVKQIQTQLALLVGESPAWGRAIEIGASTMAAQAVVQNDFQRFSEDYLKRLNSPPIPTVVK